MSPSAPSPALLLALGTAVLNLGTGFLNLAIARAPGWRAARVSAGVALSAGFYGALNVVFCTDGLGDFTYLLAGRLAYLVACAHCVCWLVYAFGGPEADFKVMPSWVRRLAWAAVGVSAVLAVAGLHLQQRVEVVDVGWAGVQYHYPVGTKVGDVYGVALVLLLGVPFGRLAFRAWNGERMLWWQVAGFCVFLPCMLVELLVASRAIRFLSLADIGFLVLVLPLSAEMFRRFVADARRLRGLSTRLAEQVTKRTEQRDRTETALEESERLAALGRLAAGVGHEISNPLTYLQLALDEIGRHSRNLPGAEPIRSPLADAQDGARRIARAIEGLRGLSKPVAERTPLQLERVIQLALRVAGPEVQACTELDLAPGAGCFVLGNESRLVQALTNLLTNAGEALRRRPGPGWIRIALARNAAQQAVLSVTDNGVGIASDNLRRLMEPYFTTRAAEGALGLGLFIARGIVVDHGGQILIDSLVGKGTTVSLTLPACDPPGRRGTPARRLQPSPDLGPVPPGQIGQFPAPACDPGSQPAPAGQVANPPRLEGRCRVLLVDDEPALRKLLARALARRWEVTCAADGSEALEHLEREEFDAVICDLMMPGMTGMELAERMESRWPELRRRVLFITGGVMSDAAGAFLARPDVVHAIKPVPVAEIEKLLHSLLAEPDANRALGGPWVGMSRDAGRRVPATPDAE